MAKEIPLTQGFVALVDDEDFERVSRVSWFVSASGIRNYARGWVDGRAQYLHRFILNAPKNRFVDHVDGNGLNNSKCNLRFASNSENQRNRRRNSGTSYKGIYYVKSRGMYRVRITHTPGRREHVGDFDTELEAARAYDMAAIQLFGEFARTNFPRTDYDNTSKE